MLGKIIFPYIKVEQTKPGLTRSTKYFFSALSPSILYILTTQNTSEIRKRIVQEHGKCSKGFMNQKIG